MKQLFIIILSLVSLSALSQNNRIGWNDLYNTPFYRNPVKFREIHLDSRTTPATSSQDTSSSFIYVLHDTLPLLYFKGKNYLLGGGTTNIGGGSVSQDTKDTAITWIGNRTYVDIPSGITYNPVGDPDVQITAATSTEGDTGQGFSTAYTYSTQTIRIVYPFAPIGVFTYTIKFTKADHP